MWPYINQGNSGGNGQYTRVVRNVGLGPALVRSFQATLDGKPVATWGDVRRGLLGPPTAADSAAIVATTYSSLGRGTVLIPGATLNVYTISDSSLARRFWASVQGNRLHTRVCYCSLYDDCWISDSESDEPTPIAACPHDPKREFAQ